MIIGTKLNITFFVDGDVKNTSIGFFLFSSMVFGLFNQLQIFLQLNPAELLGLLTGMGLLNLYTRLLTGFGMLVFFTNVGLMEFQVRYMA